MPIELTEQRANELRKEGGDWRGERQGLIYKSRSAYDAGSTRICYVPEQSNTGYTYWDFLNLAQGDFRQADRLFVLCTWQCPETILDEDENEGDGIFSDEEEDWHGEGAGDS